jgi:hypothetical protein
VCPRYSTCIPSWRVGYLEAEGGEDQINWDDLHVSCMINLDLRVLECWCDVG